MLSCCIPAVDGGVFKSDGCVNFALRHDLREAAATLRGERAWPRDQRSQVTDLVDPFLFPFTFERSKVLRWGTVTRKDCISRCGEGEPVKMPPEHDCVRSDPVKYPNDMAWSRRFQWLPFDVKFELKGEGAARYADANHEDLQR